MKMGLRYFIIFILLLEVAGRFAGLVFPNMERDLEISKPTEYAGFHPLYGPYPVPGKFEVFFSKKWCQVTQNKDSNRITRPATDTTDYTHKPTLNIYGCSFTWGVGINDSSTYPFLVQKALPFYNVQNKGVFAAGNILAYLQLKEEIERHEPPAIALITYASFHDQRNTMNREWATYIKQSVIQVSGSKAEELKRAHFIDTLRLPQARLIGDSLCVSYKPLNGDLFPFSRYSVICNLIHTYLNYRDEKKINSNLVTRKLFYEIKEMSKKNGIRLIIACIDSDENTKSMQAYFKKLGIEYLSFGVDYEHDNKYNLYPDLHPNERTNVIYANKIIDYLKKHS